MSFVERMRQIYQSILKSPRKPPSQHLADHVSVQLKDLATNLEASIEKLVSDQPGKPEKSLVFSIQDLNGEVLLTDWSHNDYLSLKDIKKTEGYGFLDNRVKMLGLNLKIIEDREEIFAEQDLRSYRVFIDGWAK